METYHYKHFPIPVAKTVLPCGLTVITATTKSELVMVDFTFRVGSLDDSIPGISHYLEHVLLEGPARDGIHPKLRHLMRHGIDCNGATNILRTTYWIKGFAKHFNEILNALHSVCFDPSFEQTAIEKERQVILQEIREREASDRLDSKIDKILHPDIPGYHHGTGGTADSVLTIGLEELREYHRRCYLPRVVGIMVSGGITHETVLLEIDRLYQNQTNSKPLSLRPRLSAPRLVREKFKEDWFNSSSTKLFAFRPKPLDAKEQTLLNMAIQALNLEHIGAFFQELRIKRHLVYGCNLLQSDTWSQQISFRANAIPCHFDQLEEFVRAVVRTPSAYLDEEAVECVRAQRSYFFAKRDCENYPSKWNFSNMWLDDDITDLNFRSLIEQATVQEIINVAEKYLPSLQWGRLDFIGPND